MQLIALVGFKSSGKDTAANYLIEQEGYVAFSFAESLKDALASIFCWPRDMIEGATSESRAWREQVDTWWADRLGIPEFTPRWAMQNIGTELFRKHFHDDLWILNIERKISLLPADAKVVIRDGRFPNELALARRYGGITMRVRRGPDPDWFIVAERAAAGYEPERVIMREHHKVHESEWAWIATPIDYTLNNNTTIPELHEKVRDVLLSRRE